MVRADGGSLAEGGVEPQGVVEAFDEAEDGHAGLGLRGEAPAIRGLASEGGQDALATPALWRASPTGPIEGSRPSGSRLPLAPQAEGHGRAWRSPIRVGDRLARAGAAPRPPRSPPAPARRARQVGHGPAHDLAAPGVEHDRQVQEARGRRHEGDVRDPELAWCLGCEVAVHEVWGRSGLPVPARGRDGLSPRARSDPPRLAHQPGDALAPVPGTPRGQRGMDATAPWASPDPRWIVRLHLSGAASALTRADGSRRRQAWQPDPETPSPRAIVDIESKAWFALTNRKAPTAPRPSLGRSPARDPSRRAREDVALQPRLADPTARTGELLALGRRRPPSAAVGTSLLASRPPPSRSARAIPWRIACAEGSTSRARSSASRPARTSPTT